MNILRSYRECSYREYGAALGIIAAVSLTGCGGSSAGDLLEGAVGAVQKERLEEKDFSQSDIVALTEAREPQESAWDQRQRLPAIRDRFDHFLLSSVYGESFDDPDDNRLSVWRSSCSGVACTVRNSSTDISVRFNKDGLYPLPEGEDPVLTKQGVTTMYSTKAVDGYEYRSYGAWLDHSAFTVGTGRFSLSFDDRNFILRSTFRRTLVSGDLTGSKPNSSATWRGLMVGTPQSGANKNNFLQGDATLTFDLNDGGTVDAVFADIKNIDRKVDYSTPTIRFDNVPVSSTGTFTFGAEDSGRNLRGGFYGPDHAEAAGVFESSGIVGSFGVGK